MQLLTARDEALFTKLVRLAGGNTDIVMQVLSKPARTSVSLTQVVQEIETLRSAPGQPDDGPARPTPAN
jgi:hypothetical protein